MPGLNSILETIGNTPLVRITKFIPEHVNLYVKLEYFNPMGSIKDRMALAVIEAAEKSGELKPGQTVIEATSGNTGIGLAMVCAQKGYPLVVTMAESNSVERRKLLRFLGAKVVLTPASEKGTGMLRKAQELADAHGFFLTRQFDNETNASIHTQTTAQEILKEFKDVSLDYWVSGFGTGGTVKGVSRAIKEASPATKVIVAEPDNAQLIGSTIKQARNNSGAPTESHPGFRPHLMQGWTPDFISSLMESAVNEGWIDSTIAVNGDDALRYSREMASKEGIFAGITSGATVAAGIEIAKKATPGTNIVCMVPDTGERYLSTPLFEHIKDDMTVAELKLSESTPLCRFDSTPISVAIKNTSSKRDKERAEKQFQDLIGNDPVVIFALQWCEFCWAAKKLFKAMGVPVRVIELDSRDNQASGFGTEIRKVLSQHTGSPTIPQVFIDGNLLGGNMDLFDSYKDRSLHEKLTALDIKFNEEATINPGDLLPGWLQPRISVNDSTLGAKS